MESQIKIFTEWIQTIIPNWIIPWQVLFPIISNIDTATYQLGKHLAKLLSPLSTSEYAVNSTKDCIEKWRKVKVPKGYQMVSFDIKVLFTNVPLEYTIDLVLKRFFENHEISTPMTTNDMR